MVILHIANLDSRKSSGPNINVPQNVIYGNNYETVALYNLSKTDPPIAISDKNYFNIRDYDDYTKLPSPFNNPDIVIFQNMYIYEQYKLSKKLVKRNIPYIVVPRCSLTKAAQDNKKIKKKIGNLLFFNKFVYSAKSIQFLTNNEYLESKKAFSFKNYFIVGNGVNIPQKKYTTKTRSDFKIVFIGRYNVYHKGLDILLDTIKNNFNWFKDNNIKVCLYGSDSENGYTFLKNFVSDNDLKNIVYVEKAVFDEKKESVLLDSDVFIHTSRLEGQPTAVIEAISYGVPVIVTPGTNILDIVKNNKLGFTCDLNPDSIFVSIKEAYNQKNNFDKISMNEIEYSNKHFDWNEVVKQTIDEYYKILN